MLKRRGIASAAVFLGCLVFAPSALGASISTQASGDIPLGGSLSDSATVSELILPTGTQTVTFNLYGPNDVGCGTPIFTSEQTFIADAMTTSGTVQSGSFQPTLAGTYRWVATYAGDGTAANTAISGTCGDPNETRTVTVAAGATISQSVSNITVGGQLTNTATVNGLVSATGPSTVTFTLYGPGSAACTGAPLDSKTQSMTLNGQTGGSASAPGFTPATAGTYRWQSTYSGDANNGGATSSCDPVTVGQGTPTLTTNASGGGTVGSAQLSNTATLSGLAGGAGGTVSFALYGPNDDACAGSPVFTAAAAPSGSTASSGTFTPSAPGTYRWSVAYSGDQNNAPISRLCADAASVTQATPTIATAASAGGKVGITLTNTATVSGLTATAGGSVTLTLYSDATCTLPVFTSAAILVTAGPTATAAASFKPTAPGTYRWVARYSGDAGNAAVTGPCADATTLTLATPTIATVASPAVTPAIKLGAVLSDTATVSGLEPVPAGTAAGTLKFDLYSPTDTNCTGTPIYTETKALTLGPPSATGSVTGTATSANFTPTAPGTYRWIATFGGDANNLTVRGACNDAAETRTVIQATPTIATLASPDIALGSPLSDTATVSGLVRPLASATVTFRLYGAGDPSCQNALFTSAPKPLTLNATQTVGTAQSGNFTPTALATYRWIATYNGDANNLTVKGVCNDPAETRTVASNLPTLKTTASPGFALGQGQLSDTATVSGLKAPLPGATVRFRLFGPGDTTCTQTPVFTDSGVALDVNAERTTGTAQSAKYTPSAAGTYRWIATYNGDGTNNAPVVGACGDPAETVTVGAAPPTAADPPPPPAPQPPAEPTPDATVPVMQSLAVTPVRFRAARKGPSLPKKGGAKVTYRLSEPARVRFGVEQAVSGRRVKGRCVASGRSNRKAKRCTRYRLLGGSFTLAGKNGLNSFRFSGRLSGVTLPRGGYRFAAVATDAAGNASRSVRDAFTIR